MSCPRTPPPVSPRVPKKQQQSWDGCSTPPIQLFAPGNSSASTHHYATPPRSPTSRVGGGHHDSPLAQLPKSPKSPRIQNNPQPYYYETRSPKSPRKFTYDSQRSPKFDYDDGFDTSHSKPVSGGHHPPSHHPHHPPPIHQQSYPPTVMPPQTQSAPRSPKITYSNGDGSDFYEMHAFHGPGSSSGGGGGGGAGGSGNGGSSAYEMNMRRSPTAARKFVFDAVSPRGGEQQQSSVEFEMVSASESPSPGTFQFCSDPRKTRRTKPPTSVSTTRNETRTFANDSSNQYPVYQSGAEHLVENNKRHSNGTESGYSEYSTTESMASARRDSVHSSTHTIVDDSPPAITHQADDSARGRSRSRRHAINITSNPGYQVLHASHSTLDRTCSDSVVSLRMRCRKSTSDLTNDAGGAGAAASAATPPSSLPTTGGGGGGTGKAGASSECGTPVATTPSHHRRRGSSKGGLAYLASRRNSRDSMKSAVSNASIFSNEDIGPLAFQASARGRQRRTSNFLELPIPDHIRPRVCSLPERPYNPRQSDDLYRLRTFSISKGTVVNCGDSIISRRSRSNTSVNSTNSRASERSPFEGSCCGGGYAAVDSLPPSPTEDEDSIEEVEPSPRYRVVMMGDAGVGKTALVSQFMTSEYMNTYDASLDDEFGEKTVSVLLDGEETEMIFIDHPSTEMSVENSLSTYEPHSCVVVYSVVQRNSFRQAEETINYLWREKVTHDKCVILVGNKVDLARSRVITYVEGATLAKSRASKFIETSSGIQHNVDELLVGILKQIRLKEQRDKKMAANSAAGKMSSSKTHMSLHLAKEILQKIGLSDISKSKSCENLHIL